MPEEDKPENKNRPTAYPSRRKPVLRTYLNDETNNRLPVAQNIGTSREQRMAVATTFSLVLEQVATQLAASDNGDFAGVTKVETFSNSLGPVTVYLVRVRSSVVPFAMNFGDTGITDAQASKIALRLVEKSASYGYELGDIDVAGHKKSVQSVARKLGLPTDYLIAPCSFVSLKVDRSQLAKARKEARSTFAVNKGKGKSARNRLEGIRGFKAEPRQGPKASEVRISYVQRTNEDQPAVDPVSEHQQSEAIEVDEVSIESTETVSPITGDEHEENRAPAKRVTDWDDIPNIWAKPVKTKRWMGGPNSPRWREWWDAMTPEEHFVRDWYVNFNRADEDLARAWARVDKRVVARVCEVLDEQFVNDLYADVWLSGERVATTEQFVAAFRKARPGADAKTAEAVAGQHRAVFVKAFDAEKHVLARWQEARIQPRDVFIQAYLKCGGDVGKKLGVSSVEKMSELQKETLAHALKLTSKESGLVYGPLLAQSFHQVHTGELVNAAAGLMSMQKENGVPVGAAINPSAVRAVLSACKRQGVTTFADCEIAQPSPNQGL